MSDHQLQRRLSSLRSRALRLLLVRGVSAIVASVVALVIGLGLIDYMVRFRDRGVLVIFAASVLGVFAWTIYRFLSRLQRVHLGDTELALQIESCFPAVKDHLASAVEFLKQSENDAVAGSAAMRRTAIAQAAAQCDEVDFAGALNVRPAFRTALGSLMICILAAGLIVLNPAAARTALARLAFPLGNEVWPKTTHLQLKSRVERIARGQPLEVEVVDALGARLPVDCHIHYRLRDAKGKINEENEAMRPLGQAMIARRENLTRSLEFRVTGGDDQSMPWIPVEVLDPPAITSLSVEVFPPEYTNWPHSNRDATSTLPLLAGSRVQLSGEAVKPLRSAVLHLEGGREIAARVESDGRKFHVGEPSAGLPQGLVLDKSSAYTIALIDRDGIQGGDESWQFRVQSDAPPSVVIEQPKTNLFVTARARVDLRVKAYDDLRLRDVVLIYSSSGATAGREATLPLYASAEQHLAGNGADYESGGRGDQQSIEHRWELEQLKLLSGTQLTVCAVARDYRGQVGRSEPRTFTIITPEELQERLAARQSQILAELARLLQLQRDAHGRVRAIQIRLHETGGLEQAEIDRLQSAEFNQREIVRGLTDRNDGLWALVAGVLSELDMNRVDNPDFVRRMQGLLDEFTRFEREQFPPIGDDLTAAIKGAQFRLQSSPRPAGPDLEDEGHLARAGEHQQHVIESLENMLSQLRQWDDYRRFHRDVAQLIRDQEEVARGTAELGRRTVGRDVKELSPQEMADLKNLAERQSELARRENRIEQEMEQTIAVLRPNEPLAADTLSDALAEARRLAIAAAMLSESGKIRDNGLGQAPAEHQRLLQDLQTVLDILANNRAQEDDRLLRGLGEAAQDLEGLRKRQAGLHRQLEDLARAAAAGSASEQQNAELQRLAREEEAVRQETLQMGRRLERLLAAEAARSAAKSGEKMDQASSAASNGAAGGAARHARDAEELLDDTVKKLRARRAELKIRQAIEQQARMEDALKHLHNQEKQIEKETREFADAEHTGPLSRAQVFGLLELARQQALLRDETERLSQSLDDNNVFRLGLSAAEDEMQRAAALLQDQQTGSPTQQAEQATIARLAILLAALEPEDKDHAADNGNPDNKGDGPDNGPGNRDGPNGNAQPHGMIMLAELKAAKLWQEELNRRTQQLQLDSATRPPEELREQYARLAEEQSRLAAATLELLGPQKPEGDDANENTDEKTDEKKDE